MAPPQSKVTPSVATATTQEAPSLLDQVIGATKQTERDRTEQLIRALTEEALKGTVTFDRNLVKTFNKAIAIIESRVSDQLNEIIHNERFLKLEGSWRGLHYLVHNSKTDVGLKIRMLQIKKAELGKDLEKAVEFDQSQIFKKIYGSEFDTPGGHPYGALIGDYEWTHHPDDVQTLRLMSGVSAAAFAPFISGTGPAMFGFQSWSELSGPRDLAKQFEDQEHTKWRSFRETEDSRFVSLVMPRVIARVPYGKATKPVEEFAYEEAPVGSDGKSREMDHDHYCWMNAAYVMGTRLTDAFSKYGICTAIRGAEGGGKVTNLPTHTFKSDEGESDSKCPTEIAITGRREYELSKLGFLPLSHYKNTDYAVFFGGQTVQAPKKFDKAAATENAAISARLPYIMATSRFAHCLKIMARDKIGTSMEASDCERQLNQWIQKYVDPMEGSSQEARAQYPLRDARVEVKAIPGKPGAYNAIAYMQPWLQMEELTASMRMVARVPERGSI